MTDSVKIIVRNISSKVEDYVVDIELSKTVGDLKKHLQENYPTKPSASTQKLIFAGRLLQDSSTFEELFKMVSSFHIPWLT